MARSDLVLTAFAACMFAPAAAEARTILVCHTDWARCVALEALAPAYFQGRTIRMEAPGRPMSLTVGAQPAPEVEHAYRDYFFTEDGYFIRDGEGVAFQAASFETDGRMCAAGGEGALCAYLVRMQPDQFGAGASNAVCFAAQTGDEGLATLVQCAAGEWGGDRFNLRVRSMVANLFGGRESEAAAAPAQQMSCAYLAQANGAYALDCAASAAPPVAPTRVAERAEPAPVSADEGCAYEARAEGGFVLNCTASPAERSAPVEESGEASAGFGLLALLPGLRPSAPRQAENDAPACAYVNRDGGFHLECD